MRLHLALWSCGLLVATMAVAVGGGFYEGLVVNPVWTQSPPASFALLRPATGVPPQAFWIPVHAAITVLALAALSFAWRYRTPRAWLLVGVGAYVLMRVWSAAYFIPEMLAFQQVPLDAAPTLELLWRVDRWTSLTGWRTPLDLLALAAFLGATLRLQRRARLAPALAPSPAPRPMRALAGRIPALSARG